MWVVKLDSSGWCPLSWWEDESFPTIDYRDVLSYTHVLDFHGENSIKFDRYGRCVVVLYEDLSPSGAVARARKWREEVLDGLVKHGKVGQSSHKGGTA